MHLKEHNYILKLKLKFESYSLISKETWSLIESIISFKTLEKNETLLRNGQVSKNIYFICKGALRAYITDYNGNTYNKNLFLELFYS